MNHTTLKISYFIYHRAYKNICDILWENPAHGGADGAFLDQPFPYVYRDGFLNCAESKKIVFCRCSHITKSPSSYQSLFFLSLHKPGFPR